jgi:hypothetical protein
VFEFENMGHDLGNTLSKVCPSDNYLPRDSSIWNLPDLDCAVLASAGDNVVVVRAPLDVENGTLVTGDQGRFGRYAPQLENKKRIMPTIASGGFASIKFYLLTGRSISGFFWKAQILHRFIMSSKVDITVWGHRSASKENRNKKRMTSRL